MLEFQKSHRERLAANIEKKVRSICTSVEKKMIDPFPLYMFYSCEDPARAASFLPFDSCLFLRARESYLKLNVLCSSCANVSNHIWVSLSVTALLLYYYHTRLGLHYICSSIPNFIFKVLAAERLQRHMSRLQELERYLKFYMFQLNKSLTEVGNTAFKPEVRINFAANAKKLTIKWCWGELE